MKTKYLPSLAAGIACGLALNFAMPDRVNAIGLTFSTGSINALTNTFTTTPTTIAATPTSLTLNLTHSNLSDLEVYLTSSSGKILALAATLQPISATINPTFSDSGAFNIDTDPDLYSGTYRPYNLSDSSIGFLSTTPTVFSFADFGLEDAGTTYTLSIIDNNSATNTGSLNSATLNATPVPFDFDGSAGIAIVGVAVAFRYWQKKRKKS